MLSTIREKTQGWIAGTILALLAIPFAIWGINNYFEGDGQAIVAEVEGTDITADVLKRELDEQRAGLQRMLGRAFDPAMLDNPQMKMAVLNSIVSRQLVAADVQKQGYRIGDRDLAAEILSVPAFQRNGKFDRTLYEALLRQNGLSPVGFEAQARADFLQAQTQAGFAASAIVTQSEVEQLAQLEAQRRQVAVAILRPEKHLAGTNVSAGDIEAYYQKNAESFMTPERVKVSYVTLSAETLAKSVTVTEADVRQAYESDSRYVKQGDRRASHILIPVAAGASADEMARAKAKVEALQAQLNKGADFAKLAKENSADTISAAKGGDLGFAAVGTYVPEFEAALAALRIGETSPPVKTTFGYHLIRLTAQKPGTRVALDKVRKEIEKQLKARKGEERYFEMVEKLNTLAYEQSDSLAPASRELGLEIRQSDWFTRQGGTGIAAERKVVNAAFEPDVLRDGRNSATIEIAPNTLVVLRLASHEESRQRPLAEVRAGIEKQLRLEAAMVRVRDKASQLAGAQSVAALEKEARAAGAEWRATKAVGRREAGMDGALLAAVFKAGQPAANQPRVSQVTLRDGSVAVFAVTSVEAGTVDAAARERARRDLMAQRGAGYYENYRQGLRQAASVKLYASKL